MGRNKIEIALLKEPKDRKTTYNKRIVGLKNKARELSILCGTDVVLVTFPPNANGEIHQFCNRNMNDVMKRLDLEVKIQGGLEDGAPLNDPNLEDNQVNNQAVPDNPANNNTFNFQEPIHNNQLFGLPLLEDVCASGDFTTMLQIHHELKQYLQALDNMIRTARDFHLLRESMNAHSFGASTAQSTAHNQFNSQTQFLQGTGHNRQHLVYNNQEENQHGNQHGIGVPNPQLHINQTRHQEEIQHGIGVPNPQLHFNQIHHQGENQHGIGVPNPLFDFNQTQQPSQSQQAPHNFNPQGNFSPNFKV